MEDGIDGLIPSEKDGLQAERVGACCRACEAIATVIEAVDSKRSYHHSTEQEVSLYVQKKALGGRRFEKELRASAL